MNICILMGRITAPLDLKYTPSGAACLNFTIAIDRGRKDADGNKQTDFIDCVAWQKNAENIAQYFDKGRLIAIRGNLQKRSWKTQAGENRSKTEVVVDWWTFCGDKAKDSGALPDIGEPVEGSEDFDPFASEA